MATFRVAKTKGHKRSKRAASKSTGGVRIKGIVRNKAGRVNAR